MKKRIVVAGSFNTDMVVRAARIPRPGETVLGGEFLMAAGGKGANQAVAAARAGGAVSFIARVGDDLFGRRALEGFRRDRINIDKVGIDRRASSGVALIVVGQGGENAITVASGANARLTAAEIRRAAKVINSADILLLQLEIPLPAVSLAAAIAGRNHVRTILNPAPARPLPAALLNRISVLTPNESEAEILTGIKIRGRKDAERAALRLAERTEAVVLTMGAQGLIIASGSKAEFVPAFKVKAVDTTGAGDVFNGALAISLAEGKSLSGAARFASAAAALSVTKWGAQPSAPRRTEIERFIARASRRREGKEKP